MKRGEIYWANLHPRSGSEQSGKRPVLVISHDGFNQAENWRSIIVIPLSTSENQLKRGPTVVLIPKNTAGISQTSVALCHQITTLDRSKLNERIGHLPNDYILLIEQAITVAVGIYSSK